MKAVVYERYGSPEVLEIKDIAKPVPGLDDILIRVVAATVSSADWRARSLEVPPGFGLISRIAFGFFGPRKKILGTELSGVVEATGQNVTQFRPGDEVVAFPGLEVGCHAEYRTMPQNGNVVRKPKNLNFEQAAALSFGGSTALFFLRTKGKIRPGESVLIIGASGSVGSAAVQLAKHFGARVTAVCSTSNVKLVKSIGADHVIDYHKEDFLQNGETYDLVFDTVGAATISKGLRSLKVGGRLLLCAESLPEMLKIPFVNLTSRKKVIAGVADETREDLVFLAGLAEKGALTPVVDRTYAMSEIKQAHAYVATGRKRGSVVVLFGITNLP